MELYHTLKHVTLKSTGKMGEGTRKVRKICQSENVRTMNIPRQNLPSQQLRRLMLGEGLPDGAQSFYVLAGTQLSKWAIHNHSEKVRMAK